MIKPQLFTARLADRLILNPKYQQLFFELTGPHLMEFEAGQYVSIALPNSSDRRSYSICSGPAKNDGFQIVLDITPNGKGVQYLTGLKIAQEIEFLAPLGVLTVPAELSSASDQPLIFVATGSGIGPFDSILEDQLQTKQNKNEITLYWGMRHEDDLFWLDEFEEMMDAFPNFHFHPVLSQPSPAWSLCRGHVTDCLLVHEQPANAHYFACGGHSMVPDVEDLITKKQIPKTNIHVEKFF